jgi:hypothetical protein
MNNQAGISLSEVLISLFLASLIMTVLMQLYLGNKRQYLQAQHVLSDNLEVQWVSDLFSDSVRRAGFTPCLGVDLMEIKDWRNSTRIISGIETPSQQLIQINRMSEHFAKILKIQNALQVLVPDAEGLKEGHPVMIADCDHGEVHQVFGINKLANGYLITLKSPLMFSYAPSVYLGQWLEEQWFIKHNSLHYKLFQAEELTPLIHSLEVKEKRFHNKRLIEIILGLDHDKSRRLIVAVRGS